MKRFSTQNEANRYADKLDARGLDPIIEKEGDFWVVYCNRSHWDD